MQQSLKMKYNQFMSFGFGNAWNRIASEKFPFGAASNIKQMNNAITKARTKIQGEYTEMVKKFAKVDEKGEFIHPEGNPGQFDIPDEKVSAFKEAETAFGETTLTIPRAKMPCAYIEKLEFTPAELTALELVFEFPPEESEATPAAPLAAVPAPNEAHA